MSFLSQRALGLGTPHPPSTPATWPRFLPVVTRPPLLPFLLPSLLFPRPPSPLLPVPRTGVSFPSAFFLLCCQPRGREALLAQRHAFEVGACSVETEEESPCSTEHTCPEVLLDPRHWPEAPRPQAPPLGGGPRGQLDTPMPSTPLNTFMWPWRPSATFRRREGREKAGGRGELPLTWLSPPRPEGGPDT